MPFFTDLRRRSRASFRQSPSEKSYDKTNGEEALSQKNSSEKLSTLSYGSDPPSGTSHTHTRPKSSVNSSSSSSEPTYPANSSTNRLSAISPNGSNEVVASMRPIRSASGVVQSKRYSLTGLPTPGSANGSIGGGHMSSKAPQSQYAPRVTSVSDGSWVHQKVLLIYGHMGDLSQRPLDGTLTITHHQDSFPQTIWPVCASTFKALIHLNPGRNEIRLEFFSPKLVSTRSSISAHSSRIQINFLPMANSPPLQLVVLVGKDSPGTYDAVPERVQREGNDLNTAIRKYRMAAYLWQAFTGEQMYRHGLGRRCFRFEEEWQTGSLTFRDQDFGQMRNEARIHVLRTDKTVAELRDIRLARRNPKAGGGEELLDIATKAVRRHFNPQPGQVRYVSVLLLDSHWDPEQKVITGHAAMGSGSGDIRLSIFGSHALQSYPSCLEEIVPAFTDCTRTDPNYVANDGAMSGSNWEAASHGIGSHLRGIGHLFGCPIQESGIMQPDVARFNRTFITRESYAMRTKEQGAPLVIGKDESAWHRLDALRFRTHPCFRLVADAATKFDDGVQVWPVDQGRLVVTAKSGVAFIEVYAEGDEVCQTWIEYLNGEERDGPSRQVTLTELDLKSRLPVEKKNKKLRLEIFSIGQGRKTVEDLGRLLSKKSMVKTQRGTGFRGTKLGRGTTAGSKPGEVILHSAHDQTKLLRMIKVYHSSAIDGLGFHYEDSTSQMFGKNDKEDSMESEFVLDTRRGEIIIGFFVRADVAIDAIEILTSLGRRSGIFGNPLGGSGYTVMPPRGYSIAGVSGSCGTCIDSISLIITR